jgi:hypothetical protein
LAAELITFNQSRIKTFNRCPKQYEYKYIQLLNPKKKSRPLFTGSWIHRALETHYVKGDWKVGHQEYVNEWEKLFIEEKEELSKKFGPIPNAVARIMRSYEWYYRNDGWKPVMVEQILEVETPLKPFVFKGRLDLVIEDNEGLLWLVDHKSASMIPQPTSYHAMDPQLMLYPWAAQIQYKLNIAGVIYNYVRSKPPSVPGINKDGSISRRRVDTDYPTLLLFLKKNGYDPSDFVDVLRPLAKRSPFLRRYRLPRESQVTKEVLLDTLSVVKRTQETKRFTRTITRECMQCPYHDLCRAELNGFNTEKMRETNFTVGEEDYVSNPIVEDEPESDEG